MSPSPYGRGLNAHGHFHTIGLPRLNESSRVGPSFSLQPSVFFHLFFKPISGRFLSPTEDTAPEINNWTLLGHQRPARNISRQRPRSTTRCKGVPSTKPKSIGSLSSAIKPFAPGCRFGTFPQPRVKVHSPFFPTRPQLFTNPS